MPHHPEGVEASDPAALAARVCHEEQVTIWSDAIAVRLSMGGYLRKDWSYEDTLAISGAISDEIRSIVESAFGHPELAALARPAQAVPEEVRRALALYDEAVLNARTAERVYQFASDAIPDAADLGDIMRKVGAQEALMRSEIELGLARDRLVAAVRALLAAPPERVAEGERDSVSASEDWLDTPIGGDLLFLGMRFAKGVRLRTVIEAARRWRAAALTSGAARPATAADSRAVPDEALRRIAAQIGEAADDRFADWQIDRVVPVLREALAALAPTSEDDETETCFACGEPLLEGQLVLEDVNEGAMHATCCGPERESYVGADGEPLRDGEPIPRGVPYKPIAASAVASGGQSGDGWQPIETAPKGGGKFAGPAVLVWAEGYLEPELAQWEPGAHAKSPQPYWSLVGRRTMDSRSRQPTHWRPLPPPPNPAPAPDAKGEA